MLVSFNRSTRLSANSASLSDHPASGRKCSSISRKARANVVLSLIRRAAHPGHWLPLPAYMNAVGALRSTADRP
jgi:hypothetical protein